MFNSINNTICHFIHTMKKICTHDGRFHCDQVLACVFLRKYTQEFKNAEVFRSRDPSVWAQADILVDVGGKYQPPKLLDHHQIQFQGTYPNYDIRLSSAGLVYLNFPEIIPNAISQIIAQQKLPFEPIHSQEVIKQIRQSIYKHFVIYVDANDNGVSKVEDKDVSIPTSLWSRVGKINPMWWQENANQMELFCKAMNIVQEEFHSQVRQKFLGSLQTKQLIKQDFNKRKNYHPSGKIVVLEKYLPWQKPIFELEEEEKCQGEVLYVLYPQKTGDKWRIQAVPKQQGSFESRCPLKEAWRGIKDDEKLKNISGLNDITFVHATGFIGGAGSLESTVKMAVWSMQI